MAYDLLIKDARVVDGSGMPAYAADVAVSAGRIAAIGRLSEPARRTIHADGLTLAPGFIDQHTHMDAHLLWDPAALPLPEHGVTTLVTGHCGLSLMPARPGQESAPIGNFARLGAASGRPVLWTGVTFNSDEPDMWRQQVAYLEQYFEQGLRLFGNSNIVPFANRFNLKNGQFLDGMPTWRGLTAKSFEERKEA